MSGTWSSDRPRPYHDVRTGTCGWTVDDVEEVLANPVSEGQSKSTGYPAVWGHVPDGRYIIVVYEEVDEDTIRVITA